MNKSSVCYKLFEWAGESIFWSLFQIVALYPFTVIFTSSQYSVGGPRGFIIDISLTFAWVGGITGYTTTFFFLREFLRKWSLGKRIIVTYLFYYLCSLVVILLENAIGWGITAIFWQAALLPITGAAAYGIHLLFEKICRKNKDLLGMVLRISYLTLIGIGIILLGILLEWWGCAIFALIVLLGIVYQVVKYRLTWKENPSL